MAVPVYFLLLWIATHCFSTVPKILDISYHIAFLALVASAWVSWKALGRDVKLLAATLFFTLIRFIFLLQHQPQVKTYDLPSHLGPIFYMADHFGFEPVAFGRESHQPPLYYALSGIVVRFVRLFDKHHDMLLALGSLNFFFFSIFLLYGIRILSDAIRTPFTRQLGIAVLLLWPANLLHGFRISNDILLYLAFAGCICHFMRWYRETSAKELRRALLWMAVGFGTKNSALLLPVMLAPLVARKYCHGAKPPQWAPQLWQGLRRLPWRQLRWPLIALALCILSGLGRTTYLSYTDGTSTAFEGRYRVQSHFIYDPKLLGFDYHAFIDAPYAYEKPGRVWVSKDWIFWDMYLHTMNFGQYHWRGWAQAKILDFLLLGMWVYMVAIFALQCMARTLSGTALTYFAFVWVCVLAQALIRMYFANFPPWADARHLYIVVVFFLACYASLLEGLEAYRRFPRMIPFLHGMGVLLPVCYGLAAACHLLLQMTYGRPLPM